VHDSNSGNAYTTETNEQAGILYSFTDEASKATLFCLAHEVVNGGYEHLKLAAAAARAIA
jgi:hypothetical protein